MRSKIKNIVQNQAVRIVGAYLVAVGASIGSMFVAGPAIGPMLVAAGYALAVGNI